MKFKTEEITNYMYNKIQWLFQPKIWLVIFPVQYKLLHLHFVPCKAGSVHGIYLTFKFFATIWYE